MARPDAMMTKLWRLSFFRLIRCGCCGVSHPPSDMTSDMRYTAYSSDKFHRIESRFAP